jgi:hypothetical protein
VGKDQASTRIVKRMDDLFAIDARARTEAMNQAERHAFGESACAAQ